MGDSEVRKRRRSESEEADSDIDSQEVKRMRDNLLDCLDEDSEIHATGLDLDSFMRSFEKEITAFPSARGGELAEGDLTSDSGDTRPDLEYLLEASDDDLGLPPTSAVDSSEFGAGLWGFETEVPVYDPRGFGLIQTEVFDGEYAVIEGFFDHFELGDFLWEHETLLDQ